MQFMNSDYSEGRNEKTVVVLGSGRGGTSAVAGGLRLLGVDFPFAHPFKHEWSPINLLGSSDASGHLARKIFDEQNKKSSIWGWKSPKDVFEIEKYAFHLRNPHFVVVCRNLFDNAECINRREKLPFEIAIREVIAAHKGISDFIQNSIYPTALLSYEELMLDPQAVFSKLASWLGKSPDEKILQETSHFIRIGAGKYAALDGVTDPTGEPDDVETSGIRSLITQAVSSLSYAAAVLDDDIQEAKKIDSSMQFELKTACSSLLTELMRVNIDHRSITGEMISLVSEIKRIKAGKMDFKHQAAKDSKIDFVDNDDQLSIAEVLGLYKIIRSNYLELVKKRQKVQASIERSEDNIRLISGRRSEPRQQ